MLAGSVYGLVFVFVCLLLVVVLGFSRARLGEGFC